MPRGRRRKPAEKPCEKCGRETVEACVFAYSHRFCSMKCVDSWRRKQSRDARRRHAERVSKEGE